MDDADDLVRCRKAYVDLQHKAQQELEQANQIADGLSRQHASIAQRLGCDNKTSQILRTVEELKTTISGLRDLVRERVAEEKRAQYCGAPQCSWITASLIQRPQQAWIPRTTRP